MVLIRTVRLPVGVEAKKALAVGMAEKAKEFTEKGAGIYHGKLPVGADTDHH